MQVELTMQFSRSSGLTCSPHVSLPGLADCWADRTQTLEQLAR